jgi:hypothetical protein
MKIAERFNLGEQLKSAGIDSDSLSNFIPSFLKPDPSKAIKKKENEKLEKIKRAMRLAFCFKMKMSP